MFKAIFAALLVVTATSAFADEAELLQRAQAAYAARDYNTAGVQKAQEAADLYSQLVELPGLDPMVRANYLVRRSEAIYFIGQNATKKADKVSIHQLGKDVAAEALKTFGSPKLEDYDSKDLAALKARLSAKEQQILADAIYHFGIHLGQWGQANGVMESLSQWPTLRDSMRFIIELGYGPMYNYGPYRAIARGYHKIPGMFGGDKALAEKYLRAAIQNSLAPGKTYSKAGYNNIFMAELLIDLSRDAEAKALLSAYITANPTDLEPEIAACETRHAIEEAKAILDDMN